MTGKEFKELARHIPDDEEVMLCWKNDDGGYDGCDFHIASLGTCCVWGILPDMNIGLKGGSE